MSYIGKEPADSFISFAKQDFSTSATTSYTLDNAVANENELALFINFVRQEPTTAYTASGTTLTLTSATASSDDMYCVYLGQAKQTVNAPDGSVGNSQVAASIITGQTAETSIATDDTVLIHDTSAGALRKMTRANFVSGVGGAMTPAFQAVRTSSQNFTDQSEVKAQFDVETFDTASAYDNSSNYRFTPQTAGKYYVYTRCQIDCQAASNLKNAAASIYKNGSTHLQSEMNMADNQSQNLNVSVHGIVDMNGSSDYLEVYVYANDESGNPRLKGSSFTESLFGAYKIIE